HGPRLAERVGAVLVEGDDVTVGPVGEGAVGGGPAAVEADGEGDPALGGECDEAGGGLEVRGDGLVDEDGRVVAQQCLDDLRVRVGRGVDGGGVQDGGDRGVEVGEAVRDEVSLT